MNTTTSLDRDQILNLCELIHTSRSGNLPPAGSRVLGLFRCIQVTVLILRHNLTQELLADIHTVSQATISRVVAVYTPLIAEALQNWVPSVGDLDPDRQYIIDGTLVSCWSWHDRPELYSGKHHTTGVNLQVACTLAGQLAWISPPLPGSVHDAKAIKESGFLAALDSQSHIGDKGYIGLGMITPRRNPPMVNSPTATKETTRPSTASATSSNVSSRTSKPGVFYTPITAAPTTPSKPQYKPSQDSSSPTVYE